MKVAVVAHVGKTLGGGLAELRQSLSNNGVTEPMWSEVAKSRYARKQVRQAIGKGAKLIVVWGGDGMVQQCIDVVAGTEVALAIIPAGTANLLATNLNIPLDIEEAVRIALHGVRRPLDVGRINGECFAVMGGAGFDGVLMADVSTADKEHLGRVAYMRSSVKAIKAKRAKTDIRVDGARWFSGPASCVLVGNVGTVTGGLRVFDGAKPDDGLLDVGVVSAEGLAQWARVLGRVVVRAEVDHSPFVQTTRATKIDVRFDRKMPYEIDGGARKKTRKLKIRVRPHAVIVCVPVATTASMSAAGM
jgi:diacylglycerol kinase (ATP)